MHPETPNMAREPIVDVLQYHHGSEKQTGRKLQMIMIVGKAEQWLGIPYDISHLWKIGCDIWAQDHSSNQLLKGQLLGYRGQLDRQPFLFGKLHEVRFTPPPRPLNNYEEVVDDIIPLIPPISFTQPPAEQPTVTLLPSLDGNIADILPVQLASPSPSPPPAPPSPLPQHPPPAALIPPRRSNRIPILLQILLDHQAIAEHEEEARKQGELWARDNQVDKREPEDKVQVHFAVPPSSSSISNLVVLIHTTIPQQGSD
ncbi:hypothetical protein BT96DRAFT_950527 [Gymnopus androsaceus JB14]|uniref:Uncharacterized protein n=1 Tax=Gymnopus androsaceus JB14 TaxID=1447944 RepID=A0A6A4GGA3_9AGAR|nr:hypothetical protein BT96DRAFT_950527 [Gymnopus androsaceus JB14]